MSTLLEIKGITHSFKDKELFEDVCCKIYSNEHIGLIGKNGAGKSTLMKMIAKQESPDLGDINWIDKVRVGYMDQHLDLGKNLSIMQYLKKSYDWLFVLEAEMIESYEKMADPDIDDEKMEKLMNRTGVIQDILHHNDFYDVEHEIKRVASGLGINHFGWDKSVDALSGGQRTKLLLVSLLLKKPDVLLLDEPTNYLDEGHIEWLKNYLFNYEHTFILISHDIPFMNAVVNLIYHVENKKLKRYKGDYDNFVKVNELEREQLKNSFVKQQKEIKKLEVFVAKNSARASTSSMAKSRQKQLEKIDRIEIVNDDQKIDFTFLEARAPSKIIFETKDLVIGYDKPLSKPLTLTITKGERIVLIGTNGLGKTTLINTITEKIKPISGQVTAGQYLHIGYFQQEDKQPPDFTTYEEIYNHFTGEKKTQQFVRMSLSKCGLKKEHVNSKLKQLSGGEQAKVRLCKILNDPTNILVLDEPTNHLDKVAKLELKKALLKYTGTLIMVCHEPDFYDDLEATIWDCEEFKA